MAYSQPPWLTGSYYPRLFAFVGCFISTAVLGGTLLVAEGLLEPRSGPARGRPRALSAFHSE